MARSVLIRRPRAAVAVIGTLAFIFAVHAGASAGGDPVVMQTVKGSFESTMTKMKKAITAQKLVIVKEVPFTQMLSMVGVKGDKMMGLEIFHPRYGKVLYASDKNAFLEVPLRILVHDKGGEVMIRYRKPSAVFSGYAGLSGLGDDLDQVFARIVDSVAK